MTKFRISSLVLILFLISLMPASAQVQDPITNAQDLQTQGKIDEALNIYGGLIGSPETSQDLLVKALLGRAGLLLAVAKKPEQSLADAQRVIDLQPENAKAYLLRGICFRMGGAAPKALQDFDKALSLEPGLNRIYMFKGLTHITLGELDQAAGAFEKLNLPLPHYGSAFVQLARAFFQADKFKEALTWADKALTLNPDDTSALSERAGALQKLALYEKSLAAYNEAIKLSPKDPGLYVLKSSLLMTLGDYPNAEDQLSTAILLAPKDYVPRWWRARVRSLLGQSKEALVDLEIAQKLSRGNMALLLDRAALRRKMGDFEKARVEYRLTAKAAPQNLEVRFARGLNDFLAGDFRQASKHFKSSLADYQGGQAIRAAWLYISQARSGQDGLPELKNAAQGLPQGIWPQSLFSFLLGQSSTAELMAAAVKAKPNKDSRLQAQARFFIAQKLLLDGRKEEAVKYLKECVASGPSWSRAFEAALQELRRMDMAQEAARATLAPVF